MFDIPTCYVLQKERSIQGRTMCTRGRYRVVTMNSHTRLRMAGTRWLHYPLRSVWCKHDPLRVTGKVYVLGIPRGCIMFTYYIM